MDRKYQNQEIVMLGLIELKRGLSHGLVVEPRWPDSCVYIDATALRCLQEAQNALPDSLHLVLTRAFQKEDPILKRMRLFGAYVFKFLYPSRKHETKEIFGHNGHALDGTHLDVSITYNGEKIKLLPFGVFTAKKVLLKIERDHLDVIMQVRKALEFNGFAIHANKTEALQIHCDLKV